MKEIIFQGPYGFLKKNNLSSIFESPLKEGVYFWTSPYGKKEVINYIGISNREFKIRMLEHLKCYLSGDYEIIDPDELKKGKCVKIWDGVYGLKRGAKTGDFFSKHMEDFSNKYKELYPKIFALLKLYKIYISTIPGKPRFYERVEAAIYNHLYAQKGVVGNCIEKGIICRHRRIDEKPITIKIICDKNIIGLPDKIVV